MLNENIRTIRKSKGLSQEELAIELNVVRQTISKWEQGLSVPDADMLISISEVFEIPVSALLGETVVETKLDAKEPVLVTSTSLLIQAALYAAGCMSYLLICLLFAGFLFLIPLGIIQEMSERITAYSIGMAGGNFIQFLFMAAGLCYCVQNRLSSRRAGWIMSLCLWTKAAVMTAAFAIAAPMVTKGNGTLAWSSVFIFLFYCIAPFVILGFFYMNKSINVMLIYGTACILAVIILHQCSSYAQYIGYVMRTFTSAGIEEELLSADHIMNLLKIIGDLAYMLLLVLQARVLHKEQITLLQQ